MPYGAAAARKGGEAMPAGKKAPASKKDAKKKPAKKRARKASRKSK